MSTYEDWSAGEKLRTWEVRGSLPPVPHPTYGDKHMYSKNIVCYVVTHTLERATELARQKYPAARFHVVQAHGRVDYIDESVPGTQS